MQASYLSNNQFSILTDKTSEFVPGRRVMMDCGVDGIRYSSILSSNYSGGSTIVTIKDTNVTSNLEDVKYGIVSSDEAGALPDHQHSGAAGDGGTLNIVGTFIDLTDTPADYESEKYLKSTSSGTEWSEINLDGVFYADGSTELSGHLIPDMTNASGTVSTRDIGSSTKKIRNIYAHDVYVDAGSLYVNNKKVLQDDSDTLVVSTDEDQDLRIRTKGTGDTFVQSENKVYSIGKGGVEVTVPGDRSTKHLNFTNESTGGNITFYADGGNAQVQFSATKEINFSAPTVELDGNVSILGNLEVTGNSPSGATNFLSLSDTPSNYEIGKYLISTSSGISFIDISPGGAAGGDTYWYIGESFPEDELWTPVEIETTLWLDAADEDTIILDGGSVSRWNDKSGNTRHAIQNDPSRRPGFSYGIDFRYGNHFLSSTWVFNTPLNKNAFIVGEISGGENTRRCFFESYSNIFTFGYAAYSLEVTINNRLLCSGRSDSQAETVEDPIVLPSGKNLLSFHQINNQSLRLCRAGSQVNNSAPFTSVVGEHNGLMIGTFRSANDRFLNGLIYEILLIDRDITEYEHRQIEGYLAHKWDLTDNLPVDHPYKNEAPTKKTVNMFLNSSTGDVYKRDDILGWDKIGNIKPSFLNLTDTPSTYSGIENKYLKTTNSGIEAVDLGSISDKNFWQGSQEQYDALESYDDNTMYFITGYGFPTLSGSGLPPGGNTNQLLTKLSDADYHVDWVDPTEEIKKVAKKMAIIFG